MAEDDEITTLKMDCEQLDQDKRDVESMYNELLAKCDRAVLELNTLAWNLQIGREVSADQVGTVAAIFDGLLAFA